MENAALSYFGVTIHAVSNTSNNNYDHSDFGHIPSNGIHISHVFLSSIMQKKIQKVNILIPNYFVTDGGSNCEPTIKDLNSNKKECLGHLLYLILKDIHNELKYRLPQVFLVQLHYGKSPVFQSYMKSMDASRYTIPSYVETRFYSLYKLFHTINVF